MISVLFLLLVNFNEIRSRNSDAALNVLSIVSKPKTNKDTE